VKCIDSGICILPGDDFRDMKKLFIVQGRIFESLGSCYTTPQGIIAQHVYIITDIKQWFYPGSIKRIQLFYKGDHLLKIGLYACSTGGIKLKPGEIGYSGRYFW
jgi:hypothetical protein